MTSFPQQLIESFQEMIELLQASQFMLEGTMVICDMNGFILDAAYFDEESKRELEETVHPGNHLQLSLGVSHAPLRVLDEQTKAMCEQNEARALHSYTSYAISINQNQYEQHAVLGWLVKKSHAEKMLLRVLREIAQSVIKTGRKLDRIQSIGLQHDMTEEMDHLLYPFMRELQQGMNDEDVLKVLVNYVHHHISSAAATLWMSQDYQINHIPVKLFSLEDNGMDEVKQAFIEGRIIRTKDHDGVYAIRLPLIGMQGVYGVLEVLTPYEIKEEQLQMVIKMTDAAGIALENAKLFEQSNTLIRELRIVNDMTEKLNQSLKPIEIYQFAKDELLRIFSAEYCCMIEVDKERQRMIIRESNLEEIIGEHFSITYGLGGKVLQSKEPIILPDYAPQLHGESRFMKLSKGKSMMASPIIVQSEVVGIIILTHRLPRFFTYNNYRLFQVLSSHIGLAIMNATLLAEVSRMVITDRLTGLYARHYLDEVINVRQKSDECGGLIVVDIDYFKKINDTFGHQVGDKVLVQVSQIIQSNIRKSDIPARWGGEEIAIYLPQASMEETFMTAERIRQMVLSETDPEVTVSCGVSSWSKQDIKITVESLFYRADMALYEAKNNGRNVVKIGAN